MRRELELSVPRPRLLVQRGGTFMVGVERSVTWTI